MKVSVILPTYNERKNIGDLIDAIQNILLQEEWEAELIVVDDNSPDKTSEVVLEYQEILASKAIPELEVKCLVRVDERGLATAIKHGIQKSTGNIIIVMDTDFNHDPAMIPQMVKFLEFYDLLIGSRFVMGGGMEDRGRYYSSMAYNMFVRLLLRLQVQDNLSGFLAIRREKLMTLDLDYIFRGYGEYFIRLLYVAHKKDYHMLEVPVYYILRRHGQSKSRFFHMLKDYTSCVLSLWVRGNHE